jgi:hypothetical protein
VIVLLKPIVFNILSVVILLCLLSYPLYVPDCLIFPSGYSLFAEFYEHLKLRNKDSNWNDAGQVLWSSNKFPGLECSAQVLLRLDWIQASEVAIGVHRGASAHLAS